MMLATKLILIEGFPGSGKSTTTTYLGNLLPQCGTACRSYQEVDSSHPIDCFDYEIKGLTPKMVALWQRFVAQALPEPTVTVIESRLWQNTALFMYMSENSTDEILAYQEQVGQALAPLAPVLIYLYQEDVEAALSRMCCVRGEEKMAWMLGQTITYPWFTARDLTDLAGWVQFFTEWQGVADLLYADWPFLKVKIANPHQDWTRAYARIASFLQV